MNNNGLNNMTTEIKHRWNGSILFTSQAESLGDAVIEAVKSNTDLSGADLSGADLIGASLSGANLSGAYLRGNNLRGTNLSGTNLNGAYLSDASLRDASLRGANLNGADLSGTNLRDANLRGAYLRSTNLSGTNLNGADLNGADLSGANLSGAYLSGTNLSNAIGYDANTSSVSVEKPPTIVIEKSQGSSSMIDWKKLVRTKGDKTPVRIICTDAETFNGRNIVGIYDALIGDWHNSGAYLDEPVQSGMDLENVPEPGALPEAVYYSPSLKSFWASSKAYPDLIKYVPEVSK